MTRAQKDAELGKAMREADVVILLTKGGQAGVAYFNHLNPGRVPHTVEVSYPFHSQSLQPDQEAGA
jgi:hypothetical protein